MIAYSGDYVERATTCRNAVQNNIYEENLLDLSGYFRLCKKQLSIDLTKTK